MSSSTQDGIIDETVQAALSSDRDVVSGVIEGGFTVWEGTRHLLQHLKKLDIDFSGKRVIDLGCGAGLLGLYALMRGASHVAFQVSVVWCTLLSWLCRILDSVRRAWN